MMRPSPRPVGMRAVTGVAAIGALALAARRVRRRRSALDKVAHDLRTPILYAVPSVASDRGLRIARSLGGLAGRFAASQAVDARSTAEGVRVLVYDLPGRQRPSGALLWIHGGGLILGAAEQGHEQCSQIAAGAGVVVVSVEYRLAPEDPFPAGLEDCMAAMRWLHAEAGSLGIDPERIAVGGDSAGGGLAAAVCQRALDQGGPAIAFQLLVYPMLDDRTTLRTDLDPDGVYLWSPAANRYAWTAYLGHRPSGDRTPPPHAAPARRENLAGLPPAWLGVGDLDLFYDEDIDYARRLEAAGVQCDLHVEPGMWHGADSILRSASTSKRFRARMTAAVVAAVGCGSEDAAVTPRDHLTGASQAPGRPRS
jgi:acetyl esterase/lipase